jgi:hypothetical protein
LGTGTGLLYPDANLEPGDVEAQVTEVQLDTPSPDWRAVRLIVAIWAIWAVCLLGFQEIVSARLEPERPDFVLEWTPTETGIRRMGGRPYLAEADFNTHIAFDSEYYLSIAVVGYDDPEVPQYVPPRGAIVPLNYAFLPAYPYAMRVVAAPAAALGMEPVTAAAFAGVAVSLIAALGAMFALHYLARPHLGIDGGVRAATYLLIFPTGFFLAQVYSEAFFLAASFGALAFLADRRLVPAGLLAIVAVLTRPVGLALVAAIGVALALAIVRRRRGESEAPSLAEWAAWAFALIGPVAAYAVWATSAMGRAFELVQREYFGRELLNVEAAWNGWSNALGGFAEALPETRAYYGLEVVAIVGAVIACVWAIRRWPAASVFGLVTLGVSLASGAPQGMVRYALAVPAIFLVLARLGASPAFDRGWTIASVLLMALLAALYSVDFWVA